MVDGAGRLIGIITDRDITVKLVALGASIPHAQVSDCMTSEAFACSADSSLESCISAMSWHQLRRIPIVDDEHRVVGTISQGDLACYVWEHPERVEARHDGRHSLGAGLLALTNPKEARSRTQNVSGNLSQASGSPRIRETTFG